MLNLTALYLIFLTWEKQIKPNKSHFNNISLHNKLSDTFVYMGIIILERHYYD